MSASSGSITTSVFERIAALDGTNYRSWAFSMKMLLKAHELWEVIEVEDDEEEGGTSGTGQPKVKRTDAKWRRKDQLALSNIALAVKPSEQEHIYNCNTAREAWNCLKEMYEGKGTHRFLSLLKSISTAKLDDGVKMKEYIRGVRQTADQLAELEVKLEKVAVVGFILNGLPDVYRYLVVNLESQVKTISYEDLSARLMDEEKQIEEKRKIENQGIVDPSLKIENQPVDPGVVAANLARQRGPICNKCNERGHMARNCPEKKCTWQRKPEHDEEGCCHKKCRGKEPKGYKANAYADVPAYSAIFG